MTERMRQNQEVQVKESRWMEETPQRWKQPKGADRTEMRKEEKRLKCTLLNGSAWSTEKKYMRRYKGTFDIIFGMNTGRGRMKWRGSCIKRPTERWRFAANAARITDETTSSEDGKHTSGGVVVAVDSDLGAVVGAEEERLSRFQAKKEELPKHG